MKRATKVIIGVGVVAVLAGITVASIKAKSGSGVKVHTAKVSRKELVSLVTANGTVQAKTKVDLSANIMGQITQLNVQEGDAVHKGDLLLVIDQAPYRAAVESRRAALQALDAALVRSNEAAAQARRDRDRAAQQFRDGLLPEADNDRTKSTYDQAIAAAQGAERQVKQAEADLASADDALAKTEIRAPMDGIVTRRNIERGEVVVTGTMNNPGTVLMTISDMSTIEAALEVDQTDVPHLRVGQQASVLVDAFPGETFPAVVSEIGSSPIQGTSLLGGAATGTDYQVKVTLLKHPERIRPGLTVTADITTDTKKDVMTVPIGALILREPEAKGTPAPRREEGGKAASGVPGQPESVASRSRDIQGVYLVEGGKVVFRPVTTGIQGEMDVEVSSGLKDGDEVVVGPFSALRELKPGDRVVVDNSQGGKTES